MDRDIVACDHRLRRQINVLFAQVDRRQTTAHVGPVDCARLVDKRDNDIEAAGSDPTETSETLDQHHCGLRHDLNRLDSGDQHGNADDEKNKNQEKSTEHLGLQQHHWREWHNSPPVSLESNGPKLKGATISKANLFDKPIYDDQPTFRTVRRMPRRVRDWTASVL